MPLVRIVIAAFLGLSLLGCATASPRAKWTENFGGLLHDHREQRLSRVGDLFADQLSIHCTYQVLDSTEASAYAWPDGSIYVSRGLADLLDDRELTAVIAHELGHLLAGGHVTPPAGLRGDGHPADAERAADAVAVQVLARLGISPDVLASALARVAMSEGITVSTRRSIGERAELLRATEAAELAPPP